MKKGRPKTRRKKQRTDYIKAFQQSLKSKKARSEEAEEESAPGPAPGPAPRPARKRKAAAAAAPTRKPSARSRKTTPAAAPQTNDGISAFIVSDPESFQLPPSGPERDKYSAVSKFILKHLLHARARSAGSLNLDSCSLHVVATAQDPAFTAPSTTFEHGILTKARKRSHVQIKYDDGSTETFSYVPFFEPQDVENNSIMNEISMEFIIILPTKETRPALEAFATTSEGAFLSS